MSKKLHNFKLRRRNRTLLIISLVTLLLFFVAALVRIGVGEAEWAGMTVSDLTSTLALEFNVPIGEEGVVVNWVEEQAYNSGVKEGDFLKAINNKQIRNVKEFLNVARGIDSDEGVLLDILRDRGPLYITLYNRMGLHGKIK